MKSKKKALTPEEKLSQALLPREEWPYELPKGWVWTRLGVLSANQYGYTAKALQNADLPKFLRITDIQDGNINWGTVPNCKIDGKSLDVYKLTPEDIVIARTGATTGKSCFLLDLPQDTVFASFLIRLRVKPQICKYFIYLFLQSDLYWKQVIELSAGIAQPGVNSSKLKGIMLPLPPFPEQQRIVNKIESLFAKLDEAGDRLQKVLDGYEARRAAILHEAFSGKCTGDHGAGDMSVPKGWRKVKLSDVCTINPKKLDTSSLEDSLEVSFIPMASVDEVLGEVTKPDIRNLGKVKKGFTNFQEGDVVFAKITPCMENGKSAVIGPLLNDIGYGTTEFYVLRCHPELYNRFLYHLVRSIKFRSEAKSQMTGAVGQQRVPKNFMADYEILLPPLNEQIQIVQMVDTFFKKEYEVRKMSQNVIEQISLLKKSILARAFRGELGTQDFSDPSALELLKECVLAGKEVSKS
mgnify:CR=1 FL=1